MFTRISQWCLVVCGSLLLLGSFGKVNAATPILAVKSDSLALLLPDGADATDPRITVWTDAIAEEGLQVTILHDSEFMQPAFNPAQYAGIVLPDGVHTRASDALVAAIKSYVNQGGNLMLTYDAGSLTDTGFYPIPKSRFSDLVGIDYVLYDQLRDKTIGFGPVTGTESTLAALRIAPGKYMTYDGTFTDVPTPVNAPAGKPASVTGYFAVSGYVYGYLGYPGFVTQGSYTGTPLLTSPTWGLAAGYTQYGKGATLFVNMPLGYLKHATDGVFLHGFLHYFAVDLLHLAYLSSVPQGKGGMVFNWHLCAEELQDAFLQLKQQGIFKNNGPFSIHICAGPDCVTPGDGLGFNLANNPTMQQALRQLGSEGHQIGCHGGWIHDYWGANAPATLPADPAQQAQWYNYLIWNKQAVEATMGKPVTEYAPPEGNEPDWVDAWLEQNGVLAFYFTGNTGLGPTRSYRNGQLLTKKIWSIPVSPYGPYATFEEFEQFGVGHPEATSWYLAMTDFTSQNRCARMIYCHPPGALDYVDTLQALFQRTAQFQAQGHFAWYTMTDLSKFMSSREKVTWSTSTLPDGMKLFQASHPTNLKDFTWLLPRSYYTMPIILKGSATVNLDLGHTTPKLKIRKAGPTKVTTTTTTTTTSPYDDEWVVTAQKGTTLQFTAKPIVPATP